MLELLVFFVCLWAITNLVTGLISSIADLVPSERSKATGRLGGRLNR